MSYVATFEIKVALVINNLVLCDRTLYISLEVKILQKRFLPPSPNYSYPALKINLSPHKASHNYDRKYRVKINFNKCNYLLLEEEKHFIKILLKLGYNLFLNGSSRSD
jgi:hypothetical protein